jgi:hypothetical protein
MIAMTLQYTNRAGQIYYLSEGKTKSGKPQYYFTLKEKDNPVDKIPKGYEIYEHPENAQVFMRKIRPRLITELEERFVKNQVKALQRTRRYRVDCKDKYITVYESNLEIEKTQGLFGLLSSMNAEDSMDSYRNILDQNYTAMLRFLLEDKEKRLFSAERFCFRGLSDRWIYLEESENFRDLVKRYVDMLGTDKFFESPYF